MKVLHNGFVVLMAMIIAVGITACGSGGGAASTSSAAQSTGVITGFGSIYVNGIHYNTDTTTVSVDGNSGTINDLDVGMVVTVNGSSNPSTSTGTASSVSFDDELEGIVTSNSITAGQTTGTMVIMGQTVTVDSNTLFESDVAGITTLDAVVAGNIVEVSGYASGTGDILATRLEVKATDLASYLSSHPEGVEVKGIISALDTSGMLFNIGSLVVDYSGADISDFNSGLANGMRVEVKSVAGLDSNGRLVASKVEPEEESSTGSSGDEVEIKGAVTQAVSNDQFMVMDKTIIITANTEFDGLTRADIAVGVILEVEGHFDANGDIVAEEIESEEDGDQEVTGTVTARTVTGTNTGTLTVDTTVVTITNNTMMVDERDQGVTPEPQFNLGDIQVGDFVEVKGYIDGNGDFIATKVERDDLPSS